MNLTLIFRFFAGKPKAGFSTGSMYTKSFYTRVMFFIIKNDRFIKWWIENGPDIWDVVQPVIDLLANFIM